MAGPGLGPFSPNVAGSKTLAATTTTANTALVGGGPHVEISNEGTATAFVELGTSAVVAVATPVPFAEVAVK